MCSSRFERCLELANNGAGNFECSLEHDISDAGAEQVGRQRDRPWVGAAERRIRNYGVVAQVDLVMHQAPGEDEDVRLTEHLGIELVGGVDEAHGELALGDGEHLGAPRVRVRRIDPPWQILQQRRGHTEAYERRKRLRVHLLDGKFRRGDEPCSGAEALVCKIVPCDVARVRARRQVEVGGELRVAASRWRWKKNHSHGERHSCEKRHARSGHGHS